MGKSFKKSMDKFVQVLVDYRPASLETAKDLF